MVRLLERHLAMAINDDAPDPTHDEHVPSLNAMESRHQADVFGSFSQPCIHCQPVSDPA